MNEIIKDSGSRQEFASGAHRDNPIGKGRCDLLPLSIVAKVMDDRVLELIDSFMQTRDEGYLIEALKASVNTLMPFRMESVIDFLQNEDIAVINYENPEEIKQACLAHMMLEASKLYEAGAVKYGENNWQRGMSVNRYIDSGVRHYLKTIRGDIDEPHYRGFVWNLLCAAWTAVHKPELNKPSVIE